MSKRYEAQLASAMGAYRAARKEVDILRAQLNAVECGKDHHEVIRSLVTEIIDLKETIRGNKKDINTLLDHIIKLLEELRPLRARHSTLAQRAKYGIKVGLLCRLGFHDEVACNGGSRRFCVRCRRRRWV